MVARPQICDQARPLAAGHLVVLARHEFLCGFHGYGGIATGTDIGAANTHDGSALVLLRPQPNLLNAAFLGDQVAHESAHAWHQIALRRAGRLIPPDDDLPWMIFSEGLATQASRAAAPELAEVDYFWPRPGADTTPVQKVSYVTKVADQVCGVGYYK